jgi:CPA2 family monovalent cation:H+ antiporter-2
VTKTGSRELFTLCVVARGDHAIAYGSRRCAACLRAGASSRALVLRDPSSTHRAAEEHAAVADAFSVLFFVSVGC